MAYPSYSLSLGSYLTEGFCPLFFQFSFLLYFTQSFPIRYWIFNVVSLAFIIFYLLPSSLNTSNVWNVTIVKEKVSMEILSKITFNFKLKVTWLLINILFVLLYNMCVVLEIRNFHIFWNNLKGKMLSFILGWREYLFTS